MQNLYLVGKAARESAMDAHDGEFPPVEIGWSFTVDNPECFTDGDEWPDQMPEHAPIDFIAGYLGR